MDYYTLLDVQRFCDDTDKIDAGVKKQLARLEPYRTGADAAHRAAAKVLRDEIDQARACLTSPIARQAYERILARQRNEAMGLVPTAEAVPEPPVAEPPAAELPSVQDLPPARSGPPKAVVIVAAGVLLTIVAVAVIMMLRPKKPESTGPTVGEAAPLGPVEPSPATAPSVTPPPEPLRIVSLPRISLPGKAIRRTTAVRVYCVTSGAKVRYTTDGSDPTEASTICQGTIFVRPGTTLKVRAFLKGAASSRVVTAEYPRLAMDSTASTEAWRRAAAAWARVKDIDEGQGFDKKLREITSARALADSAYGRGDHTTAKTRYEKAAALCKELEELDSRRTSALALQRKVEVVLRIVDDARPAPPGSRLARLRQASADAKRAFDTGLFDKATSEWETTLALAGAGGARPPEPVSPEVPHVISDKRYAPWKKLCGAVAVIEKSVFDPRGDAETALVSWGSELKAACSALPADELNCHSKAVRRAAKSVLTSLEAYRKACEATQGKKGFILANRKMRRNKLRSSIGVFVFDSMILAEVARQKPSAKLAKLYTKLETVIKDQTRCRFCPGRGERECPDCRVKGRATGKAPCTRCRGTGNVACATCDGKGNIPCPSCRGFGPRRPPRPFGRGPSTTCSTCNGTGLVHNKVGQISPVSGPCPGCKGKAGPPWTRPCPSCRGSGSSAAPCPRCNGTKKVPCTHCAAGKRRQ